VLSGNGRHRFEEKGRSAYFLSGGKDKRNRKHSSIPPNPDAEKRAIHPSSTDRSKKSQMTSPTDPIREDKVRLAKIKKQRGEYSSEEVYRKIAVRLMDLFGIK
jgi:hypothetical protein